MLHLLTPEEDFFFHAKDPQGQVRAVTWGQGSGERGATTGTGWEVWAFHPGGCQG